MTGITVINDAHWKPVFAVIEPLPGRKHPILCKQVGENWEVIARFENEEAADDFLDIQAWLIGGKHESQRREATDVSSGEGFPGAVR